MTREFPFWIDDWALKDPKRVALIFDDRKITYKELADRIAFIEQSLKNSGLEPGDRIAYLGDNRPDAVVLAFACARAGFIFVPLNWRLSATELRALVHDCHPRIFMCSEEFAAVATEAVAGTDSALLHLEQGEIWFENFQPVAGPPVSLDHARDAAGEQLALLMYTSGTTGLPKGAAHSVRGIEMTAQNVIHGYELAADDRILACLPLFHVGGLTMLVLPALKIGAQVVLHARFHADHTIADIARYRITMMLGVAATLKATFAHPLWAEADTSSMRLIMTGASIIPRELLDAIFQKGIIASQVLGATEMGIGTCLRPRDAQRKIGSVGQAAQNVQIKLLKSDGSEAAQGEEGELLAKGPGVMARYWNDPDKTNPSFRDGWFRTGDLAYKDEEGFFTLVSRLKEIIISGGENIYPAEIENVLYACPGVEEVAVVAGPSRKWGETPIAFIVRQAGSQITEEDIDKILSKNLARFKLPSEIRFVEALPRNAMGKVLRSELQRLLPAEAHC